MCQNHSQGCNNNGLRAAITLHRSYCYFRQFVPRCTAVALDAARQPRVDQRTTSCNRTGTNGGEIMKYFLQTACAATLIGLSGNVYAFENGINYDPTHNPAWEPARKRDDFIKINEIFDQDLTQIKNMGFNTIKTYYSAFCTDVPRCINPAQKAQSKGLKVLLGVFEFPNHPNFTETQVSAAIAAAKNFPNTVIGIVVGNEDMFKDNGPKNSPRFKPDRKMQKRIINDITTIKNAGVSVPVTTSQRSTDWCGGSNIPGCDPARTDSLNQSDPEGVLKAVTIIGANIFPYWSGKPATVKPGEPCAGENVACQTQFAALNVLQAVKKANSNVTSVIVTEEGWPDCASSDQPPANIQDEIAYYTEWKKHKNQSFDSYYFITYDLSSTCPGDADKHFGLCLASGKTKNSGLISCP
jgi:exo-beta-1,3-glucanase (GH17 family)